MLIAELREGLAREQVVDDLGLLQRDRVGLMFFQEPLRQADARRRTELMFQVASFMRRSVVLELSAVVCQASSPFDKLRVRE